MKQLLIIGARGFGREVYLWAKSSIGYGSEFTVKGFLDDKADALEGCQGYPPIVGSVEGYEIQPGDAFICALGDVRYKRKYTEMILERGGEFINLIHPEAQIWPNTTLGRGCIVCKGVMISCDVRVGDFVAFQPYAVVGHDARIGDWCHLNTASFMGGYSVIGEMVTLHTHTVVHPHVTVEDGATVGAGSVAIRRVKAGTTVYGIPAVRLKC